MNRLPVPTRRALMVGAWAVGMSVVALVVYLLVTVLSMTHDDERDSSDRADLRVEVTEQQKRADLLDQQIRALGETPIVQPSKPAVKGEPKSRYVPLPGPAGRDGADGLPGSDGKSLPGLPGAPGQSVVGPPGDTGPTGPTGPAGPSGSAGKDGKDGSPGADGSPGSNGQDGRGITSLACSGATAPITFTVTFSDGSSQEFSCGSFVEPDPSE